MTTPLNYKIDQYIMLIVNDQKLNNLARQQLASCCSVSRCRSLAARLVNEYHLYDQISKDIQLEPFYIHNFIAVLMEHFADMNDPAEIFPTYKRIKDEADKEEQRDTNSVNYFKNLHIASSSNTIQQPKEEESIMTKKIPVVESRQFINDAEVKDMTDDQLITMIADCEATIKELESIKTPSKAIKKRVDSLKQSVTDIAAVLDNRSGDE